MRIPRGDRDPRRHPSSSARAHPQIDSAGALGIGWSLPPRPRAGAARRLDWTESNRLVSFSLLLLSSSTFFFPLGGLSPRWCAVESFSTSGEGATKSTAHALVPPEGGGLRFWKRSAYRPRAYEWGTALPLLVLVAR